METVYIESTIPSYLTSRPTENLIAAARQLQTREWWEYERHRYQLFASEVVLAECNIGDPEASQRRIEILKHLPILEMTNDCIKLAEQIFKAISLPNRAQDDAFHIAIASIHGMDYLLSWNFRHIVNAANIRKLKLLFDSTDFKLTSICSPEELIS